MEIKFIATDMDGTLLDENKNLPENFFDIFAQLEQKGVIFAAASGRQYASLACTFSAIKDKILFIAENGTLVMYQGKELHCSLIPTDEAYDIVRVVRGIENAFIVLCGKKAAYIETQDQRAINEIKNYYHQIEAVPDLLAVEDEFIKVAVLHFESTEDCVYPVVAPIYADTHQVVISGKIWLDFMHKDASKGTAIKKVQQLFNLSHEQSMSFGDYLNDIEMLKETYHSYAMANAHPEIKKLARFMAPANHENGVMQVICTQVLS